MPETLEDIRSEWESGLEPVLKVVKNCDDGFKIVFVILTDEFECYSLHRYFRIEEGWSVSVDVRKAHGFEGLIECFDVLNDYFEELMPNN